MSEDTGRRYAVVRNTEEQYAVWPADRPLPDGWAHEGTSGTRARCLDRVAQVWTDQRPLSLRTAHAHGGGE
ncbi:MbtH family protein [Streptomyces sp. NPDC047928]|uniref:MbtH family protein n=1 Tax=unclassified Streptomyces TaxID=2593676 RepID=UPI00371427AA